MGTPQRKRNREKIAKWKAAQAEQAARQTAAAARADSDDVNLEARKRK
jgi:hypothetical protein